MSIVVQTYHTNVLNLQINQAKPECGRQTLVELLIRPVQRLPSVALLLNGNIQTHPHSLLKRKICMLITSFFVLFSWSFYCYYCFLSPVDSCLLTCTFFTHIVIISSSLHPSTFLLRLSSTITDIKKHTADDNPDKITLEKAIDSLKEVMTWVGVT